MCVSLVQKRLYNWLWIINQGVVLLIIQEGFIILEGRIAECILQNELKFRIMEEFSHIDKKGKAKMVDVGNKPDQLRIAIASGFIKLAPETITLIKENNIKKGDVLTLAEFAGIQAAKKTSELIPLCHPLRITKIDLRAKLQQEGVFVESEIRCVGQTGVEMEALTAVQVALLTVYDMCKSVDKNMIIENVKLDSKTKTDISFSDE